MNKRRPRCRACPKPRDVEHTHGCARCGEALNFDSAMKHPNCQQWFHPVCLQRHYFEPDPNCKIPSYTVLDEVPYDKLPGGKDARHKRA